MSITLEFQKKIEAKIIEIEKICSIEFVPVIASRSSTYHFFRTSLVVSFAFLLFVILTFKEIEPIWALVWSVGIAGFLASLLTVPSVLRWALPPHLKKAEVMEAAHRFFLEHEVFSTEHRSGIMIFISELERSVFILADRGISLKIPPQEWVELGSKLASDFQSSNPGLSFLGALEHLAVRLAPEFPPYEDDRDELGNQVRIEKDTLH